MRGIDQSKMHDESRVVVEWPDRLAESMRWGRARDEFVRIVGPGAVADCEAHLLRFGEWQGRSDGVVVITLRIVATFRRLEPISAEV